MGNPWKWTALGLMAVMGIVVTSSLTTAYLMRPSAAAPTATAITAEPTVEHRVAVLPAVAPKPIRTARAVRPLVTHVAAAPAPVATSDDAPSIVPAPAVATASTPPPAPVASAPTPVPTATAASVTAAPSMPTPARPTDCDSGGDRALRVAKPGVLGALLGAGLGAAGGAIANGGKGAGKGALIGGVAGAALGTGYGAYETKNECGTIFGNGDRSASAMGAPTRGTASSGADQVSRSEVAAPLQSTENERIQVYGVR